MLLKNECCRVACLTLFNFLSRLHPVASDLCTCVFEVPDVYYPTSAFLITCEKVNYFKNLGRLAMEGVCHLMPFADFAQSTHMYT